MGQPKASVLLNKFFNSYRTYLHSADVRELYDDEYLSRINSHPTYLEVGSGYKIHIYSRFSYEYLSTRLRKDSKVLDVGCGSGDFVLAISSQGVKTGVGLDFSAQAIEQAQRRAAEAELPCHFFCADVSELATKDVFDFIVLNDIIEHLSDKELGDLFKNLKKVLAPMGKIVIHTPNGLALCNDTDSNLPQKCLKIVLRFFWGWSGIDRTVEQIYYDQVHINIKSYRQLKAFLRGQDYQSKVLYDEKSRFPFLSQLSSNMLVIAWRV